MAAKMTFNNDEEKVFWDRCFTTALQGSNSCRAEGEADAALRARRERINPVQKALEES